MRLWSVHPKYLDARGLVALWREALLAQAVLRGRTNGYVHHPQLQRFRTQPSNDTHAPALGLASARCNAAASIGVGEILNMALRPCQPPATGGMNTIRSPSRNGDVASTKVSFTAARTRSAGSVKWCRPRNSS